MIYVYKWFIDPNYQIKYRKTGNYQDYRIRETLDAITINNRHIYLYGIRAIKTILIDIQLNGCEYRIGLHRMLREPDVIPITDLLLNEMLSNMILNGQDEPENDYEDDYYDEDDNDEDDYFEEEND